MQTPEHEIAQQLQEAAALVEVGARYRHYKSPEMVYRVLRIVMDADAEEPAVIYKALYGERLPYARLLSRWLLPAVVDGKEVARYQRLDECDSE